MRQSIAPVVLLLALPALLIFGHATAFAQVIKVEPTSFDFGDMKQQETLTTTVKVTNAGAALLEITNVEADCGCTIPTLAKSNLGPGESTDITIEFSSKKFNGKVHKAVRISSNDPQNQVVDVLLTAFVHTPLVIDPSSQRLGFSQSLAGETVTRRATFTASGPEPLKISVDETRKGLFKVAAINKLDGNPLMAALEVTVPASMPAGHQRDNVRVTTNIPEFPTLDFEMQAWVVQELNASPERLAYRFKNDFSQSIRIAPFTKGTAFKVTGAECDLPEVKLEVMEIVPNVETKIVVTGAPIASSDPRAVSAGGRMSGTIKVHTNLKNTPVIEIPVTYMVRM
jgi:hypothetical protein